MQRTMRAGWAIAAAAAAGLVACSDPLAVDNTNNPDRGSVLALPRDVESLASSLYRSIHQAHFGGNDNLENQLRSAALENSSTLNNFGLGVRGAIPRNFVDNTPGNSTQVGNRRDYAQLVTAAGTAATVLERLNAQGFTLGGAAVDARAKAFAFFGHAVALGDVALAYDSSAIPRPGVTDLTELPLENYDVVMAAAIASLDSALVYAPNASALPATWLSTSGTVSGADFARLIRSYRARFRASVARTEAQRAAVNWNAVIADATNGITTDYVVQLNPSTGWDYQWLVQHFVSVNWHQMTPYFIGMADSSGAYDAWLATARPDRQPFLIRTADRRFPSGNTRAAQQANTPGPSNVSLTAGVYFRNRADGEDPSGQGWNNSQYDHNRWRALFNATRVGSWVLFPKVENDMLAAEGYIRTGNIPAATALIDVSRTRNGLPALTGVVNSATDPVPGGASCVPRVPTAASNFTATACGTVLDAMKWEKRMETAFAGWAQWFFDGRGWGDLPRNTTLMWPVPYQELQARVRPIYSLGGEGSAPDARKATPSTYGFGEGAL